MARHAGGRKPRTKGTPPAAPEATRLAVAGYEMSAKKARVLPWKWAADRLRRSRQYWIATTRPDGAPHLMIVWGVWLDDSFWFSTGAASRKARNLAANPRCAIGTDDAGEAVILEGTVETIGAEHADFDRLAAAYKKKYGWDLREMAQPVHRLRPAVGFGLHEKRFEQTATRWRFR